MNVTLVIIQNHQFVDNIDRLEAIYRRLFHILHVVPFFRGTRGNVIPVYENSFRFQGYVAQAARELARRECSHYVFVADDLLLNPAIDESTLRADFALDDDDTGYITGFIEFATLSTGWYRAREALNWKLSCAGVEALPLMPSAAEAADTLRSHGLDGRAVSLRALKIKRRDRAAGLLAQRQFRQLGRIFMAEAANLVQCALRIPPWRRRLSFPLVGGYSDLFIVPAERLLTFAHYCGVFAATGLFAEIAIPTALALAVERVARDADCRRHGRALWGDEVRYLQRFDQDLDRLLAEFPQQHHFLHPVKLSQWERRPALRTIVVTTIHPPSKAVKAFARLRGYRLVVAGDRKTPEPWELEGAHYLSLETQNLDFGLGSLLPEDHYCRKNIGYAHAICSGARVIIDSDDDNIPLDDYDFPDFEGLFQAYEPGLGFVNPYHRFTDANIWPRGLPLDLIVRDDSALRTTACDARVGVWQGLANGEPDVDAIYRLVGGAQCEFERRDPVVLPAGTVAPFNSQNTAFREELFPLLYLPCHVTFRFTDILRGLVAQPIMWKHGYLLGFSAATVVQERNPHDPMEDFLAEIPMYRHTREVVEIVARSADGGSLTADLRRAYQALSDAGIVPGEELDALDAWLGLFSG